jgi:hypothetical protein
MLYEEDPVKYRYLKVWRGVKVIAPPAGQNWEYAVRILGVYDNIPVGQRMSFADNMAFLRREYEDNYMPLSGLGGFKEPEAENKKAFRKEIQTIFGLRQPGSTANAVIGLVARSNAMYDLVRKILTGDVKESSEPFNTLGGPMTLHVFAQLSDEICIELLEKVVDRKMTVQQAGNKAKELKEIATAREFVISACRKKFPKRTREWTTWAHFTEEWPTLDDFADQVKGYFVKQGRKRLEIEGLAHQVELVITSYDKQREEGDEKAPAQIDIENVPCLKVGLEDPAVFLASFGTQYFVMLNCTTEAASRYLHPHDYGQFFVHFVLFVWYFFHHDNLFPFRLFFA